MKPSTSSQTDPVTATAATSTDTAAAELCTTMTGARPSATAKPMYTAAIRTSPSAYTVAGSSHQNVRGEAAWSPPTTTPHSTGTRSDRDTISRTGCPAATLGCFGRRKAADTNLGVGL